MLTSQVITTKIYANENVLRFALQKNVFSLCILVSSHKGDSISAFLIAKRFHVTLHILSREICKQCLRVKC